MNKRDLSNDSNINSSKEKINNQEDNIKQPELTNNSFGQYRIRGEILNFNPNNSNKKDLTKENTRLTETANIKVVVELINIRTKRSLIKKEFNFVSDDGRTTFNSNIGTYEYDTEEFKSSSIGIIFHHMNDSVEKFVVYVLDSVPLEGDLIVTENENKNVIINLGKKNGIQVQDIFTVFSIKTNFNDPLNKMDLGDMYTRKGVIKVIETQGHFSRAKIIVGSDLAPGDLVVPKKIKIKNRQLTKDVTWGLYKGLPSLSY